MSTRFSRIIVLSFFTALFASAQTDTVYSDAVFPQWYGEAWGNNTVDLQSHANPYNGSSCVEIIYPEWGSYGFDHRNATWEVLYFYYPNQYKYLNFWFNPGADVSQIASLETTLDLGAGAKIANYLPPAVTPNTWYNVRIPISVMDPDKKAFFRIFFSNASSDLKPHIFIDNICFEYVPDTSAPVIGAVKVSDLEQDAATVSWQTDEATIRTFKVQAEGSATIDSLPWTTDYNTLGNVHRTNLVANTKYYFTITAADHQRDPLVPANRSVFTGSFTTPNKDTIPPVISNRTVVSTYQNRAVIVWETNELSMTQLDFGVGNYGTTYMDSVLTKLHTVVLTHLPASTVFQYRLASQDKHGNRTVQSGIPAYSFSTTAPIARTTAVFKVDHPVYQWSEVPPNKVPWNAVSILDLGYLWPVKSDTGYTLTLATEANWYGFNNWIAESKNYIASGHAAHRTVICMLGGAGSNVDSSWNKATSAANVNVFAKNITGFLKAIGFDGASLDWENDFEYPSFVRFAKALRAAWPDAYIDVPAGFTGDDAADFAPMKDAVDSFTPMSYMPVPQWGGWTLPVPVTPLFTAPANQYGLDVVLQRWKAAGVPASKVLLGLGGFGSIWEDANKDGLAPVRMYVNNGYPNGEMGPTESDNLVTWSFVHSVQRNFPALTEAWDPVSQSSYWTTGDSTKQVAVPYPGRSYDLHISMMTFESPRAMSKKVEYVEANGVKGFSVWTLSQLMENGQSGPVLDVASLMKLDSTGGVQSAAAERAALPDHYSLTQNYPNPFNPSTVIAYALPLSGNVRLTVYDMLGREMETLVNGFVPAGNHTATFSAQHLASGVYFYSLKAGNTTITKKMMLMK